MTDVLGDMQVASPKPACFIRKAEVLRRVGLSYPTIWQDTEGGASASSSFFGQATEIKMYRFAVTKPFPARRNADEPEANSPLQITAEQSAAIREITDALLTIIRRCLESEGYIDTLSDVVPFHLLEMHSGIASILGLEPPACWVMLELSGKAPTVIFEDRDLRKLQQQSASGLREAASGLHYQLNNPAAFTMLTKQ